MRRYPAKKIKQACDLYAQGVPLRRIMKQTGIKSTSTIQYRCNPAYRKGQDKRGAAWRRAHPEEWAAICKKAAARQKKKKS